MTTIFQIFAILMVGWAVACWVTDFPITAATRKSVGVGLAIGALATFLVWTQIWPHYTGIRAQRKLFDTYTRAQAEYNDSATGKSNQPFLDWTRGKMHPDETYALMPGTATDSDFVNQWLTYVLTPRLLVDYESADWLVFFDVDPEKTDFDRSRFAAPEQFSPGYAIARRIDAN